MNLCIIFSSVVHFELSSTTNKFFADSILNCPVREDLVSTALFVCLLLYHHSFACSFCSTRSGCLAQQQLLDDRCLDKLLRSSQCVETNDVL